RNRDRGERVPDVRRALQETMHLNAQGRRTAATLTQALADIHALRERYANISVHPTGRRLNTDPPEAIEPGFLLERPEVIVVGALERKESRGGHFREDYQERDDVNFMRHTMAYRTENPDGTSGVRLDYKPVVITRYQPMERSF